jgi:hypothetical protein
MTVVYEWDRETVADGDSEDYEDGEIIDHCHAASYAEVLADSKEQPPEGCRFEIVLVRDDDNGRSWAYVEDGKLPEFCKDAYDCNAGKVPKRFHDEVARA